MKLEWTAKNRARVATNIFTFAICFIIYMLMGHIPEIGNMLKTFFKVLAPMIWGIVIAYLLNPVHKALEKLLKKITGRTKPHPKLDRALATILSVIFLIAIIAGLVAIIVPQLIESITKLVNNFGTYMNNLETWINTLLAKNPDLLKIIDEQFGTIRDTLTKTVSDIVPKVSDLVIKIKDGALNVVVGLKDFLIGIIAAIYFLLDKEHFQAQIKKFICAVFPKKHTAAFFEICSHTNKSFSGFISGKILDSFIMGVLCFICMSVMKLDYVLLISVIVGVTNVIPFFGPIFGAVPSALLLLVSQPDKVLWFIVLILVLQQIDGNIIGPKILGNSTGLSAFWVMFAIIVGSGLFGFAGMLIGVPIFAVVYSLLTEFIEYLLNKKGLPCGTAAYMPVADGEIAPTVETTVETPADNDTAEESAGEKDSNSDN